MSDLLWVDKYKPKSIKDIFGNANNIKKIQNWLKVFTGENKPKKDFKNCILISGPPGIGKTSIAHIILRDAGYNTIEFNASELRASKIISEKLQTILSGKSIKMMFKKDIKTGVIMDEVDGVESKRECSASDLSDYINYNMNKQLAKLKKINKGLKKADKKKPEEVYVNNNPIICICNFLSKSVLPLLKDVLHIKLVEPTEFDIINLMHKINKNENLGLNDLIINLLLPYCQNDLRRTITIMEYVGGFVIKNNRKISNTEIIKFINKLGNKDMDIGLYESINTIFFSYDSTNELLLQCYHADQNFVPFIIHENFINFVDKNTNNTYEEKLDKCISYYDYLTTSQMFKERVFGNWHISEYIGYFTCVYPNYIIKTAKLKNTPPMTNLEKSALISKYNYRYYNLKSINFLSKKLNIDMMNFQILAALVVNTVFCSPKYLPKFMDFISDFNLSFKEFEKIMKLSPCFETYTKKWTKKFQKELISNFEDN